jgi:hypothetical protein
MASMPDISTLKSSAKALTRSRLGNAVWSGLRSFAVSVGRTFYSLWLQIVGLVAAVFTLRAGGELVKIYNAHGMTGDPKRLWVTLAVTLFCGWFTVASFLKAGKLRKP